MAVTRMLGTGDAALEVSAIGYGCMGLDSAWGQPMDPEDATTLLRRAHDRGVTFFDTAEAYGRGSNETLVGRALEPVRDGVVIATKFGFTDGRPAEGADSRPERIREVADDVAAPAPHRPDRPLLPAPRRPERRHRGRRRHGRRPHRRGQGPSLRAVGGRRRHHPPGPRGPARHRPAERVLACGGESRSGRSCPSLDELGIGLVPFSPLGKGFLTGTINPDTQFGEGDARANPDTFPRFSEENRRRNEALVDLVRRFADEVSATPAQVALAWLLAQRTGIVPIPGSTKLDRIEENLGAAALTLPPEDLDALDRAAASIEISGDRYNPQMQRMIDR